MREMTLNLSLTKPKKKQESPSYTPNKKLILPDLRVRMVFYIKDRIQRQFKLFVPVNQVQRASSHFSQQDLAGNKHPWVIVEGYAPNGQLSYISGLHSGRYEKIPNTDTGALENGSGGDCVGNEAGLELLEV